MLRFILVVVLMCIAASYSVPIDKVSLTPEDEFYRSLEPDGNLVSFKVVKASGVCVLIVI